MFNLRPSDSHLIAPIIADFVLIQAIDGINFPNCQYCLSFPFSNLFSPVFFMPVLLAGWTNERVPGMDGRMI